MYNDAVSHMSKEAVLHTSEGVGASTSSATSKPYL
jgi:hypothetical protein